MGDGVPAENNNFEGTDSMIVSATGNLDFHLVADSAAIDAAASGTPTPTDEIGFDWRCITQQSGQTISWWNYAVDYAYIESIGGVAACFQSGTRTGTPDQGAYEYGASESPTGGASGTGGSEESGETGGAVSEATGGAGNATGGSSDAVGGETSATGGAGAATTGGAPSAAACQPPLVQCGKSCVDVKSDPLNCGACGTTCAAGQVCSAGLCATDCATGMTQCDRACVDLSTDLLNCGACGTACLEGQTCDQGICSGAATGGSVATPNPNATPVAEESGCACATGRHPSPAGWLVLALGLLLSTRGKRSRCRCHQNLNGV
jgi:MYXO-CTERM domain-containing protein